MHNHERAKNVTNQNYPIEPYNTTGSNIVNGSTITFTRRLNGKAMVIQHESTDNTQVSNNAIGLHVYSGLSGSSPNYTSPGANAAIIGQMGNNDVYNATSSAHYGVLGTIRPADSGHQYSGSMWAGAFKNGDVWIQKNLGIGDFEVTEHPSASLHVKGDIIAENYIVSSTVSYITTSFSSGSTRFGDSVDDTHTFSGSITASGDISASGYVEADFFHSSDNVTRVGHLGLGRAEGVSLNPAEIFHYGDTHQKISFSVTGGGMVITSSFLTLKDDTGLIISGNLVSGSNLSGSFAHMNVDGYRLQLEGNSVLNQDLTTDADVQFNDVNLDNDLSFIGSGLKQTQFGPRMNYALRDNESSSFYFSSTGKSPILTIGTTNGMEAITSSVPYVSDSVISTTDAIIGKTLRTETFYALKVFPTDDVWRYIAVGAQYEPTLAASWATAPISTLTKTIMCNASIKKIKLTAHNAAPAMTDLTMRLRKYDGSGSPDTDSNFTTVGTAWEITTSDIAEGDRFYHAPSDWNLTAGDIWGIQINYDFTSGTPIVIMAGSFIIEEDWNNQVSS